MKQFYLFILTILSFNFSPAQSKLFDDGITSVATNLNGDVLTFGSSAPPPADLLKTWYLSRIETPGNNPILVPFGQSPSLTLTNDINPTTFRPTATGTGECNVFMSDYEVTLNNGNNIQLLDFDATLALCEFSIYEFEYFSILSNTSTNFSEFEIVNNGQSLILTDLLGAQLIFNDEPLSVDDNIIAEKIIRLLENPVRSELKFQIPEVINSELSYSIYSISGQVIQNDTLSNASIDVEFLQSGLYFIQFNSVQSKTQTIRFIKQ